jgi:SET domain-containing protein
MGLGFLQRRTLKKDHNFGMTHLKFGEKLIRTPLGGFLNHSDDPNCVKTKLRFTTENGSTKHGYIFWNLVVIEDIKKGEELTVKYTFYNV